MQIHISNDQTVLPIDDACVYKIVEAALAAKEASCKEISFAFVGKEEITEMHGEYFDDPTPTDCITFPIDPAGPESFLGEVIVCPEVAQEYAKEHGLSVEEETILYMIHGILHLLGYEDIDDADREEMRKQEALVLDAIKNASALKLSCK